MMMTSVVSVAVSVAIIIHLCLSPTSWAFEMGVVVMVVPVWRSSVVSRDRVVHHGSRTETLLPWHTTARSLSFHSQSLPPYRPLSFRTLELSSSFFDKFEAEDDEEDEEEEDDDEDDDDDEESLVDDAAVENFRSRMANLFDDGSETISSSSSRTKSVVDELISFAVTTSDAPPVWAQPASRLTVGTILLANPDYFCSDCAAAAARAVAGEKSPNRFKIRPELLAKFGLTIPPPIDLGPDRRADLLPVLIVVEHDEDDNNESDQGRIAKRQKSSRAVLLNRRTGYLLGDLEQQSGNDPTSTSPILEKFCIQPLWFGGVDSTAANERGGGGGLDMMHQCAAVPGAVPITDDGLYWGGDPAQAQDAMDIPILNPVTGKKDKICTGFDFKFFVQNTVYPPGALQKEIEQGTFYAVRVAKEVLFQSRDRMGTRRAKPLWTEILDLLGTEEYDAVKAKIYRDEYRSPQTDSDFFS